MLEPKNSRISLLLSFHIFLKLGKTCFRPWNSWVSIRLFVRMNPVSTVSTHCCRCGAGQEKQTFFFHTVILLEMNSSQQDGFFLFFFIVLKLNFSGLALQLFLNVWFKNWVDCHYCSTSRLLHIVFQSFALLAAKPIFLRIYLKQLEGCARSPERLNLYVGLAVWWQFSLRKKWGLHRGWCTLMTKWKRSTGKDTLKQKTVIWSYSEHPSLVHCVHAYFPQRHKGYTLVSSLVEISVVEIGEINVFSWAQTPVHPVSPTTNNQFFSWLW